MTELDDKIFSYLNGALSPEETASVEEALRADPDLAAEVSFYREIMDAGSALELEPVPMDLTVALMDAAVDELKTTTKATPPVSIWERLRAVFAQPALAGSFAVVMVAIVSVGVYRQFEKNQPPETSRIDDSTLVALDEDAPVEMADEKTAATTRSMSKEIVREEGRVDAPVRATGVLRERPVKDRASTQVATSANRKSKPGAKKSRPVRSEPSLRAKSVKTKAKRTQGAIRKLAPEAPASVASRDDDGARRIGGSAQANKPAAEMSARSGRSRAPAPSAAPKKEYDFASDGAGNDWRLELRFHTKRKAWAAAYKAASRWLNVDPKLAKSVEFQVVLAEILVQVNQPTVAAKRARPHTKDAKYGDRARRVLEKSKILLEDSDAP